MSENVADFLLQRLRDWGVGRVYGYPGDGINAIIGAFRRAGNDPELIQVRHEEMAAFMACGHAKFTGEVGVCLATSGPGAIHLLNGLYDAKLDHQPVVAIVGQQARSALGGSYQQEVDLVSLYKDVAHEFVEMATEPAQIRHLVDRAVRIALDQRTVTCIIVPNDLASMDAVEAPAHAHGTIHSSIGYSRPVVVPSGTDLQRAADILNEGEKVAMLVGAGALGAADEVVAVAETLGAGVAKALLGKAAVPDDLPFVTGSIGLLGTRPSWDLMMGCDTLLMVGSSFPYSEFLPEEGKARGVQIDLDGAHDRHALPDGRPARRRFGGDAARARPAARAQDRPVVARGDRGGRGRLAAAHGGAGAGRCRPDQPAARLLRALPAPARPGDRHVGLGLGGELVRPRRAHPRRHARLALGQPRHDGRGRPVCDRGQVRAPGPPGRSPWSATAPCR